MIKSNYNIKLKDGTILNNLELNGNNFISSEKLPMEIFKDTNLTNVVITEVVVDNDYKQEFVSEIHNAKLLNISYVDDCTWFILTEKTRQELILEEINSKLDFIAMMGDIEL